MESQDGLRARLRVSVVQSSQAAGWVYEDTQLRLAPLVPVTLDPHAALTVPQETGCNYCATHSYTGFLQSP